MGMSVHKHSVEKTQAGRTESRPGSALGNGSLVGLISETLQEKKCTGRFKHVSE